MTYFTSTQIHDAITAMAEAEADAHIAETIEDNKMYNARYESGEYTKDRWYRPQPTTVEEFDREDVVYELPIVLNDDPRIVGEIRRAHDLSAAHEWVIGTCDNA